jgi:nucleoside-diphosphate-sugar epimerase
VILVTGADGFIGSHVMRALGLQARAFRGDVRSPEAWRSQLDDIDTVVHLAALVGTGLSNEHIREFVDTNVAGTAVMVSELQGVGIRVVLMSSASVYGDAYFPAKETDLPRPESVYAATKLAQEHLCTATLDDVRVLRPFSVYGPGHVLGLMADVTRPLLRGEAARVHEDGQQLRDLVYVGDVAHAVQLACNEPTFPPVMNVGTGIGTTVLSVAEFVAEALGGPPPVVLHDMRAGDVRRIVADTSLSGRFWRPRGPLARGIDRWIEWIGKERVA